MEQEFDIKTELSSEAIKNNLTEGTSINVLGFDIKLLDDSTDKKKEANQSKELTRAKKKTPIKIIIPTLYNRMNNKQLERLVNLCTTNEDILNDRLHVPNFTRRRKELWEDFAKQCNSLGNSQQQKDTTAWKRVSKDGLKKPHECTVCHKQLKHRNNLKIHMRIHTGEKPYECAECNKTFTFQQMLKKHMSTHNTWKLQEWKKRNQCDVCNKKFSCLNNLLIHKKTHVDMELKPISCEICHKCFGGIGAYKLHMNIHTREKLFKCCECDKDFLQKSNFQRHLLTHRNEKLKIYHIECKVCNRKFMEKRNLTLHMKMHTGENPHACSECDQKFTTVKNLNRHKKSHTEIMFPCQFCGKKFMTKHGLENHINIHTRENLFKCSDCPKEFTRKEGLSLHLQTHSKAKSKEILHSNSEEIAKLSPNDSIGEFKSELKTIKAEKIDVNEIAITEYTDTEKYKAVTDAKASAHLSYKSCLGETICKEEVILPDEMEFELKSER